MQYVIPAERPVDMQSFSLCDDATAGPLLVLAVQFVALHN